MPEMVALVTVATSRGSSVPRAAAKALFSQCRAAECSVETPAKLNNSSIVAASKNSVGISGSNPISRHAGVFQMCNCHLAPTLSDRGSIASHEGLAKEAFQQLFSLVASQRSGVATPMASPRMANIVYMGRFSGFSEVCPARGHSYLCRSPGECGSVTATRAKALIPTSKSTRVVTLRTRAKRFMVQILRAGFPGRRSQPSSAVSENPSELAMARRIKPY